MLKRIVSGIFLMLLLTSMLSSAFNIQPVKAEPKTIIVPDDYPTIQEAINNANEEDTIYVKPGTYYESLVVNKSVSLIGEDKTTTIIDGSGDMDIVVTVEVNNCTLSGFTVQNGFWGIVLYSSNGSHITNNIVRSNVINGVLGDRANHNKVTHNIFSYNLGAVYLRASDYNLIANNEVDRWNDEGVRLSGSDYNWIVNNTVVATDSGISTQHSDNNSITNNLVKNSFWGIFLEDNARFNDLLYNNVSGCGFGIALDHAGVNKIVGNMLRYNGHGIHMFPWSWYNTIYHNNLVENTLQAVIEDWSLYNSWNNSYLSGGNYWSDYAGVDDYSGPYQNITGSDGIGDTPYVIDGNNQDNYPLIGPISIFNAGTWNDTTYYINIISNSTLSDFYFNPDEGAFVRFGVSGENETLGFCRVAIPKDLLWVEDGWTIYYGSLTISYTSSQDENYTYLYFTYQHAYPGVTTYVEILGTNVIGEEEKIFLGSGRGWMRIEATESVHGRAELYKIGDEKIELIITCEGETYPRTWNIMSHREYKYGERYLCYSEEWGFLHVGLHEHRRWQFWYAVGKGVAAFGLIGNSPCGYGNGGGTHPY